MSIVCKVRVAGLVLAASLMSAMAAGAVTVKEADAPGGAFSASYTSATQIGAGVETITGTGSQNAFDNLLFTCLPSGHQQLRIDFSAPAGYGYSYSAGGAVFYGATLGNQWDWSKPNKQVQVGYWTPAQSIVLDLLDSFTGGNLYLALNFTHGANLAYTISAPSNAAPTPAAVPLPAGPALMGTALSALALIRRRRAA